MRNLHNDVPNFVGTLHTTPPDASRESIAIMGSVPRSRFGKSPRWRTSVSNAAAATVLLDLRRRIAVVTAHRRDNGSRSPRGQHQRKRRRRNMPLSLGNYEILPVLLIELDNAIHNERSILTENGNFRSSSFSFGIFYEIIFARY